ncbi:MAG: hypothetical protein OEW66_10405 [Actinomycetota bacterium]|nr:hypothetical protein [Actinomycetota bacterium]
MDEHERLLDQIVHARTPNAIATAVYEARLWLADHPDDQAVASAMERLVVTERQLLAS